MLKLIEKGIVLVGFMGTGKTTVGRELASLVGLSFVDLDLEITRQQRKTIPEIFVDYGEAGFRRCESAALRELARRAPCVVATGGGIVTRSENWPLLHSLGTIVYLRTSWLTLQERLTGTAGRPLADGRDWQEVKALWEGRQPLYEQADIIVDTDHLSPIEVAEAIQVKLMAGGMDV